MDEREFRRHVEEALGSLARLLAGAAEDYGFGVTNNGRTLSIEAERPAVKIEVRPHTHSRQVHVLTASKTYKLDWDVVEAAFTLPTTGKSLREVVESLLRERFGEDVSL